VKTIEDLHPGDHEMRVNLRADLIARRHVLGVGQRELGCRLGVTQPVVARTEARLQWRLSTVQRWAAALQSQARFVIVGLPEPWRVHGHPGHELEQPDDPADIDRWLRSKAIADAIGSRFAAGVHLSRVARVAGCTYNTMSQWEDDAEQDTRLPVLQRYVRATAILARIPDAHLAVELHPDETPEEPS
jgi:hypothetical protein